MSDRLWGEVARIARRLKERGTDPDVVKRAARDLLALAEEGQRESTKARDRADRYSNNPATLVSFVNPPRKGLSIGSDVVAVVYRHAQNGGYYVHPFGGVDDVFEVETQPDGALVLSGLADRTGVQMHGLPDGSLTMRHREGKRIWDDL